MAEGFEARLAKVSAPMLRIAVRAGLVFGAAASLLLGGTWCAHALGWRIPAPLDQLFSERVQQAEPLLYVYDNDTGWKLNPHAQLHYVERAPFGRGEARDVRLRTNSEGFFDREHYPVTPYYRIAFLGDSWVEAQQVDPTQRFTDLVEGYLFAASNGARAVETMNFGVSNLGTAQEYGVMKAHVAKYRPNEVWLFFDARDDITDSSPLFTTPPLGPTFVYADGETGSRITDVRFGAPRPPPVAESLRRARYGGWINLSGGQIAPYLYARETHPAFEAAFAETRQCLDLLAKLTGAIGAKLVVVYLPAVPELDASGWSDYQASARLANHAELHLDPALGEQRIAALARRVGADFISLKPLMLEKGKDEMIQSHLSRMGHHWVADLIARRLLASECCALPAAARPAER